MTPNENAFTIYIFVPEGESDGLRIVDKSNWTGRGVVCPRATFPDAKQREEFSRTGVYILVGSDEESGEPILYIGEADDVGQRLKHHYANKDFWEWVTFFTAQDSNFNKTHAKYLESKLIALAKETKRATLENDKGSQPFKLSERETAYANTFLQEMLRIFPLVGLTAFEKPQSKPNDKKKILRIEAKGIVATGFETPGGFVVRKGSQAVMGETPSLQRYVSSKRSKLLGQGVLVEDDGRYVFTQNYDLSSPSQAAGVVLAAASNGRDAWKDHQGRSLKEIQEAVNG